MTDPVPPPTAPPTRPDWLARKMETSGAVITLPEWREIAGHLRRIPGLEAVVAEHCRPLVEFAEHRVGIRLCKEHRDSFRAWFEIGARLTLAKVYALDAGRGDAHVA